MYSFILSFALVFLFVSPASLADPAPTDPKAICESGSDDAESSLWTAADRQKLNRDSTDLLYWTFGQAPIDYLKNEYVLPPWLMAMHKRVEVRGAAYQIQLLHASQILKLNVVNDPTTHAPSFDELKRKLVQDSSAPFHYTEGFGDSIRSVIDKAPLDDRIDDLEGLAKGICLIYFTADCAESFTKALHIMSPKRGKVAYMSLPEVWKEVLTDPTYVQPLSIAALNIISRVDAALGGVTKPGRIFDDLKNAFLQVGVSEQESIRKSWQVMGLYSTRGSSMDGLYADFMNPELGAVLAPIYVFSAAMNYLDSLTGKNGNFYSLPPEVKTSCAYGKPYHFWNAAYLAWATEQSGHPAKASALGAYLNGEVYEIFSNAFLRDPKAFLSKPQFSGYNHQMRENILFDALGAVYGSQFSSLKPKAIFDGDRALLKMIRASNNIGTSHGTVDQKKLYTLWRKVIAPDAGFHSL